jgi:hypothetical protein
MRPSQKTTEERKWVLDTINKYFDVIVEEENEEEEEDLDQVPILINTFFIILQDFLSIMCKISHKFVKQESYYFFKYLAFLQIFFKKRKILRKIAKIVRTTT